MLHESMTVDQLRQYKLRLESQQAKVVEMLQDHKQACELYQQNSAALQEAWDRHRNIAPILSDAAIALNLALANTAEQMESLNAWLAAVAEQKRTGRRPGEDN